jgi:hypothetical protein
MEESKALAMSVVGIRVNHIEKRKRTIARTLKNRLGSSCAIVLVLTAKTPMGKVNPHQPYIILISAFYFIRCRQSYHVERKL